MAAKFLHHSIFMLADFPQSAIGTRKVVEVTYDSPIRLTKSSPELLGIDPLRIVPRVFFGGDADSYHVQLEPPPGLAIVDSRLFYSYERTVSIHPETQTAKYPWHGIDLQLPGSVPRMPSDTATDGAQASEKAQDTLWWSCVQGSADPMAPHIRCSSERMPRLIDGRDTIAMFQVYPQAAGTISESVLAVMGNVIFVIALFVGLVLTRGFTSTYAEHTEVLFIMGALTAGLGLGLTFYSREHLVTSQVARPWRVIVTLSMALTIGSLMTIAVDIGPIGPARNLPSGVAFALITESAIGIACFTFAALISLRALQAQSAGSRMLFRHKRGLPLRRLEYRRYRIDDDVGEEISETSDRGSRRKLAQLERWACRYLSRDGRRELFNAGVPPAIRHSMRDRGC